MTDWIESAHSLFVKARKRNAMPLRWRMSSDVRQSLILAARPGAFRSHVTPESGELLLGLPIEIDDSAPEILDLAVRERPAVLPEPLYPDADETPDAPLARLLDRLRRLHDHAGTHHHPPEAFCTPYCAGWWRDQIAALLAEQSE